jgi:hypothetical protein
MTTQGLYPQQIYHETADVGKTVKSSKRRAYWKFAFGDEELEYEVTMTHSLVSGKKKVNLKAGHQQSDIHESKAMKMGMWTHPFSLPGHTCRVQIDEDNMYDLYIDNCPFHRFAKRGPDFHRRMAEKRQAQIKEKLAEKKAPTKKVAKTKAKKVPVKVAVKSDRGRGAKPAAAPAAPSFDAFGSAPASSNQEAFDPFNDPVPAPAAAAAAAPAFDAFGSQPPAPPNQGGFNAFGSGGGSDAVAGVMGGLAGLDFSAPVPAPVAVAPPAAAGMEDPFADGGTEAAQEGQGQGDLWSHGIVNLDGDLGPKDAAPMYKPKAPTLAEMQARQPGGSPKVEVMKAPSPRAVHSPPGVQQGMGMGMGMGMQHQGMGMGMQQPMQPGMGMGMQQQQQGMGMQQQSMGMGMGMQQQGMGMPQQQQQQQQQQPVMGMAAIPNPYQRPPAQAGGASAISNIGQGYPQQQQQQQQGGFDPFAGMR